MHEMLKNVVLRSYIEVIMLMFAGVWDKQHRKNKKHACIIMDSSNILKKSPE